MQEILDSKKIKVLLADPYFNCTQNIDILLDGNVYADSMNGCKIQLGNGLPKLIKSSCGWIVQGKYENNGIKEAFCGICISLSFGNWSNVKVIRFSPLKINKL